MCDLKRKSCSGIKDRLVFGFFVFVAFALFAGQASAINLHLFGESLVVKGYISQSAQFGVAGDHYDTMQGFQQGITQALLEFEYYPTDDIKVFTSGMLYKDWAYDILDSDDDWEFRGFDESRDEGSLRDDYEDVLKECHVTWSPPGLNIRVGKQIVVWGRMDGTRIMDQINPKDNRLGPADVEFETTIIPIWLAKAEYYPGWKPTFLNEFGIEFVFNPNMDFIPDKAPSTGNYEYGIWAADAVQDLVLGYARVGQLLMDLEEPDRWSDGREYGIRIKGTLPDATLFTLNFFKGVEDNPIFMPDSSRTGNPIDVLGGAIPGLNGTNRYDDKGRQIMEPYMKGYYPDKKYVGFTFAKDLEQLYISALGGVAPLLRCEFIYEFDSQFTYNNASNPFAPVYELGYESDAIFWGLGLDWKFKWDLLNERRYFTFMPQFMHRHIKDYPTGEGEYLQLPGGEVTAENWYTFFCMLMTQYMHDKLTPTIIYMRDVHSDVQHVTDGSLKYDLWLFKLKYEPNTTWSYKAQLTLMNNDGNRFSRGMDNKDNISFTVQYQF